MNTFEYMIANRSEVAQFTFEHLILVGVSIGLALAAGLPLGMVMTRHERLSRPILAFANVVQTVPSLALFGFMISIPVIGGIGARTAIVALLLYALLPIIRNTYTGILNVDPAIREAAVGMGMTDTQLLFRVEFPLAIGVIFAGIRVATVVAVGLATLAAAIGAGGLGTYIFRGVSMASPQLILVGAIPSAAMALLADLLLGGVERRWSRGRGAS